MINKFSKFIFIILVVALALYVVLLNQEVVTVKLIPSSPVTANAGLVMITAFISGMIFMGLVALWFGMKAYFRERGMLARERQRQVFFAQMLKARSYSAAEDWQKAKDTWEQITKKDPTDIIARVELSKSLQGMSENGQAELIEALKVLESARVADPKNTEVLFRAAELNMALNNKTAALDNLALILFNHPNKRAASMARNTSEDLGRIGDAFEYQKQLEALDYSGDYTEVIKRLKFKMILQVHANDPAKLKEEIRAFVKKSPDFTEAISALADMEMKAGKKEEAAQLYSKAAKSTELKNQKGIDYLHTAEKLWIQSDNPEKAIAATRALGNETSGIPRIKAEIELIRVYIALNMLDDARKLCESFPFLIKREAVELSKDLQVAFLSLKGLCLSRLGETKLASETLKKLCELDFNSLGDLSLDKSDLSDKEAPAPRLSTP